MKTTTEATGLNDIQIGLLRMFDRKIPDDEVLEIKKVLVNHLSGRLFEEVGQVVKSKHISEKDYLALETDDFRTKAKDE